MNLWKFMDQVTSVWAWSVEISLLLGSTLDENTSPLLVGSPECCLYQYGDVLVWPAGRLFSIAKHLGLWTVLIHFSTRIFPSRVSDSRYCCHFTVLSVKLTVAEDHTVSRNQKSAGCILHSILSLGGWRRWGWGHWAVYYTYWTNKWVGPK